MTYEEYKQKYKTPSNVQPTNKVTTYQDYVNKYKTPQTTNANNTAQANAYNTLLNATNVSTYDEMQPKVPKFDVQINTSAGDTESLNTPKYQEIKNKKDNNVVKESAKTFGKGALVGATNMYDYAKAQSDLGARVTNTTKGLLSIKDLYNYDPSAQNLSYKERLKRGQIKSANALGQLEILAQNSDSLKELYNQILNGTFKGSEEDLERAIYADELEQIEKDRAKTQWARDMYAEQIEKNEQLGPIAGRVANAFGTVGNMVPTIGATMINPALGQATLFANSAGGAYNEAIENGALPNQASLNATLTGGLELATEAIGGEKISKLTGVPTLTKKLGFTPKGAIGKILLEIGSEEVEELVNTAVQPLINKMTYDKNAPMATKEDYWNTFVDTALSTVLLMGLSDGISAVNNYKNTTIEKIEESNMTSEQKEQAKAEVQKGANEIIEQVKKQNIAQTSPNTANIFQNNVQNVSNLENTYQNQKMVEDDIGTNIDKTTLTAGKNSNTRQKKRQIVTEFLENKYPNNEIEFNINYETGDVRIGNIRNKQALEQYEKETAKIKQEQTTEYNRKHPETTVEDELDLTYNKLPDEKQIQDIFEINNKIDELSQKLNEQGYNVSVEHSKASADASYINIETNSGTKQIRVANHYKSGVSGKDADINIDLSEYGSKKVLLEDIEKVISNELNVENTVQNSNNIKINQNKKISVKEQDMNLFKRIYRNAFNENGQLKSFKEQLKDFFDGKTYKGEKLIVLPNNEGLEYANVRNAPLEITQHAILSHSSEAKTRALENLPEELKNSPLALDSISRPELDARVFVLNQYENGQPLIATVHQKNGKAEVEVNKLSSIYGKNDIQNFINETIKKGGKIYKNKRTDDWLTFSGLQLPEDINSESSILNNIIPNSQNYVNNQENILPSTDQLQAQDKKQGEEIYNTMNMKKPKLEDIAKLTEEQAQLPTMTYKQRADKNTPYRRKFWDNVETSKIVSDKVKEQVNMTNYERKHNTDVLETMKERLDTEPMKVAQEWFRKDIKKATEQDVALGAILLERLQQEGRFEEAVDVVEKLGDMGTEAGRTVQMYSIFQRLTPEGMMIYQQRKLSSALETLTQKQTGKWVEENKDKFKLTKDDATFITAKVQEAQNAPTERQKQIALAEIEKRINDKLPPEAGQSVKAFRRIAMLFNPKTQVRNVVGNMTVMPLNYVTDLVATGIDKAVAKKTGIRTTALPNVKTIAKGAKKGLSETIDDYKRGIRTTPTGSKYEIQNNVKSFNENSNSKVKNVINKKMNAIDRLLSSVMEAGDRPFYEASYQNALEGQMKANGVTEPTQEMIDIASNVALSQTWQDNNNYTQAVLGIRSAFNKININGFGLGDLIIPFAKTPANLTKAMVDYSPAGLIPSIINYNDMRKAISRGDMTATQQKKFVTSVGKAVAGTILYTIAGALAKGGGITGSSDEDKDVANFEKNVLGIQPYSIKIGDKTFTYNWAQPLATPLAIMSDTYKMSEEGAKWNEILVNAFKVAGDQLVANSFLQGIQELLSSEYGNESAMDNLVGAIMDLPTQFTPTLFGQIATQFDSTKRQTFENGDSVGTMVNEVKNKIPGAKNTLAPQVNTFGEEIQNYGGDNNPFNVFLNPGNISSTNATETQKELYALYEVTKDNTIFPRQAPYSVNGGGEKVTLSSQDRADYQKTSGQYVTEQLDALFNSEFYKTLEDGKKVDVVAKIVSDADTTAKDKWIDTETTERLADLKNELNNSGIPLLDYYNAWIATQGIESDKNWKGETITNSKSKKQKEAIDKATPDLDKWERRKLYEIFNVGKSVW